MEFPDYMIKKWTNKLFESINAEIDAEILAEQPLDKEAIIANRKKFFSELEADVEKLNLSHKNN